MSPDRPFVAVTREEFREAYLRHGRPADGWTEEHWRRAYGREDGPIARFLVQEPGSPSECRMMVVNDFARGEARMFFLTEEGEERFFDQPGA